MLSDPTWGNHPSIFGGAGLKLGEYPYFDEATGGGDPARGTRRHAGRAAHRRHEHHTEREQQQQRLFRPAPDEQEGEHPQSA